MPCTFGLVTRALCLVFLFEVGKGQAHSDALNDIRNSLNKKPTFTPGEFPHKLYIEAFNKAGKPIWIYNDKSQDKLTKVKATSLSKLFTSIAVMRTMQLFPEKWKPDTKIYTFPNFHDFEEIYPKLELRHLMTHTCGMGYQTRLGDMKYFGEWGNENVAKLAREEAIKNLAETPKLFEPGEGFAYGDGHLIAGILMFEWYNSEEAKQYSSQEISKIFEEHQNGFVDLNDLFGEIMFKPLNLENTKLLKTLYKVIAFDQRGDKAFETTAEDMKRVALLAMNKGKVIKEGQQPVSYIHEKNWKEWAMTNWIPHNLLANSPKMTQWQEKSFLENVQTGTSSSRKKMLKLGQKILWNPLYTASKELFTEVTGAAAKGFFTGVAAEISETNSGAFGQSFFSATYGHAVGYTGYWDQLGWCGFYGSCIRISYPEEFGMVISQEQIGRGAGEDVKFIIRDHFEEIIDSLKCKHFESVAGNLRAGEIHCVDGGTSCSHKEKPVSIKKEYNGKCFKSVRNRKRRRGI